MLKFFETIKIQDGEIFHLNYHQKRYEKTFFEIFGKTTDLLLWEILQPKDKQELTRAKFIYDAHDYRVEYFPYTPRQINTLQIVRDNMIEYRNKALDRSSLDRLQEGQYDEILIVKNGLVCDISIANVAILENDRWISPKTPLLFGTTLARYENEGIITLEDISVQRFKNAEQIAFLNAMIDFQIFNGEIIDDK